MKMVEVFRTDINQLEYAEKILQGLKVAFPEYEINFDLEDCDNILRVSHCHKIENSNEVIAYIQKFGHLAEILPD